MNRRIAFSNQYVIVGMLWLAGMMIGMAFAYSLKASIAPIDFGDIFMPASFSAIILTAVVPLGLTFFFWRIRLDFLILVVLFINGFVHGFSSLYLSFVFGNLVWCAQLLFMFSQSCCSTLLVVLCPLLLSGSRNEMNYISLYFIISSIMICIMDYFLIIKFWEIFIL